MLTVVSQGAYAWLDDRPGPGHPNAAAVIDADGITLVDTLMVAPQWEALGEAVDALAAEAGTPIRRVVLTSSTIEHVGGSRRFWQAGFYGSRQTSAHLDQPPDVGVLRRLYPDQADLLPDDLRTHPVTHLVTEPAFISAAVQVEPVAGPLAESLVAVLPAAGIVLAGAVATFGVAPLCFQGDPGAWADALDHVAELGEVVVPGHGPVGGADDLRDQQAYLRACVAAAEAGRTALPAGPWDGWAGREHDVVNIERAALVARGEDAVPPTLLARVGLAG